MAKTGLILGSNLDGKFEFLKSTIALLEKNVGEVVSVSSVYASPPWGYKSQNDYINQLLILETNLAPEQLLEKNLLIERVLGRERSENGYTDRTIDVDILFYDDVVMSDERLILPHPRLHLRKFCLVPILEVLPNWIHPKLNKNVGELLIVCEDKSDLRKIGAV